MATPLPLLFVANGHSRRGREAFQEAQSALTKHGIALSEARLVQEPDECRRLLAREIAAGARAVIVGGGDGTLSQCAGQLAGTDVAMGVLPLGTGNTFARSLGVAPDLDEAAQVIANGRAVAVDVGRVNGRVFLNSVALGLSVDIARALSPELKSRLGLMAWPAIGARVLAGHRPVSLRLTSPELARTVRTHQIVVANGRYVAGPILATPDASLQNARLVVFALGGARMGQLFKAVMEWMTHRSLLSPEARFFETEKLMIISTGRALLASVDGETCEKTPLKLEVVPRALRVLVPAGFVADEV
jgi:YegS/Rv2252/BmrU family lipid kinase